MAKGPNLYNDLPSLDPAKDAVEVLNAILDKNKAVEATEPLKDLETKFGQNIAGEEQKEDVHIEEQRVETRDALKGGPILERISNRDRLRILILSRDVSILNADSLAQHRLRELSEMFAEIHVIILSERGEGTRVTIRLGNNIWVYPTYSTFWWKTGFDAYRIAQEQLSFAQGFRADLIVAEDPFESAVAAYFVSLKYSRPFQVHIYEDLYDPRFKHADENNTYRLLMARYALRRADSVRTKTESLRDKIIEKYRDIEPFIEVLPMYHNLSAWRDFIPTFDLHTRYPQFKFIILHISDMTALSHTDQAINGCLHLLKQYPTLGLVVVGSGPLRAVYEKFVISMGMQNQIVFEPMPNEVVSHMKSANVLIHLSEDPQEEGLVLQAAAAKLPIVAGALGIGGELFLDGESAFICPNTDATCVGEKINRFLNENLLRTTFGQNAQEIVFTRIEQDFGAYLEAYQNSIQRGLMFGS